MSNYARAGENPHFISTHIGLLGGRGGCGENARIVRVSRRSHVELGAGANRGRRHASPNEFRDDGVHGRLPCVPCQLPYHVDEPLLGGRRGARSAEAHATYVGLRGSLPNGDQLHGAWVRAPWSHLPRVRRDLPGVRGELRAAGRHGGVRGRVPPLCRVLRSYGKLVGGGRARHIAASARHVCNFLLPTKLTYEG